MWVYPAHSIKHFSINHFPVTLLRLLRSDVSKLDCSTSTNSSIIHVINLSSVTLNCGLMSLSRWSNYASCPWYVWFLIQMTSSASINPDCHAYEILALPNSHDHTPACHSIKIFQSQSHVHVSHLICEETWPFNLRCAIVKQWFRYDLASTFSEHHPIRCSKRDMLKLHIELIKFMKMW